MTDGSSQGQGAREMSCAFPCHTHQNRMHGRYAMGIRDEAGVGTETDEEKER